MAYKEQLTEYALVLRQRLDEMIEVKASKFNNDDLNYFRNLKSQLTNYITLLDKANEKKVFRRPLAILSQINQSQTSLHQTRHVMLN